MAGIEDAGFEGLEIEETHRLHEPRPPRSVATSSGWSATHAGLDARFTPDLDVALLREAVEVERGRCTFLTIHRPGRMPAIDHGR